MSADRVLRILEEVAAGTASPASALERLAWLPVEAVDHGGAGEPFARLDHHRPLRQGMPEVVFCAGKTPEQVLAICHRFAARDGAFLATRADAAVRARLRAEFATAEVSDDGRVVFLANGTQPEPADGTVLVMSAGTADLSVAEEAAVCARALGNRVERLFDVGVAGLHRVLQESDALRRAAVVIVVAGMDAALASVVGGLVRVPVVAVPTSVGYGAAFGGMSALLAMLTSCAAGVTVVNIDNGFGAACAATRINQLLVRSS